MLEESKSDKSLIIDKILKKEGEIPDTQVKAKKPYSPRRAFTKTYKAQILEAFDACESASGRGELLRKEGLYHSRISAWKLEQAAGKLNNLQQNAPLNKIRVDHLSRENEQLKKKLAQAEAIIDLQKKISELFGDHILPQSTNGGK
jgi:hypothetical protein